LSRVALGLIFFVSGFAALVFENVWFRQAGLALGSSVWATAVVLMSFMGGLGLGNAVAARIGPRLRRPVRAYAALELAIGAAGIGLVLLFPRLSGLFAAWLGPALDRPWLLNAVRLLVAFGLMIVPTAAMGATLPVLVRALSPGQADYGRLLGRLYGWNTLGAVGGALGSEWLVRAFGVRGAGLTAGLLDAAAAGLALALAGGLDWARPAADPADALRPTRRPRASLLAAAFLCGGTLLALEVVGFRLLLLFVHGTAPAFGAMLASVLLGIAAGGFLASAWLGRQPQADAYAAPLALLAGASVIVCYAGFDTVVAPLQGRLLTEPAGVLLLAARLVLPVCVVSGLLFTFLGRLLERGIGGRTRATGLLTLANTLGGLTGSCLAGFLLLPRLGMEASFFTLAAFYGLVALLTGRYALSRAPAGRTLLAASAALFAICLGAFPFGLMQRQLLPRAWQRFTADGSRIAAVREGTGETIGYLRRDFLGRPLAYRLVTNGFSMAGTGVPTRRYMKLLAWAPLALNPGARHALLISYGAGSTAKALSDTPWLDSIDVVDTSAEILALSEVVFPHPGDDPLRDPRVRVHVEDGRLFLQASRRSFDVITAEPPPPKNAGVVNLFSTEQFSLIRARLAPGGVASYWLPVFDLELADARAIVRAFCDVFDDCSLWTGAGMNWMLIGTRDARGPVPEEGFTRQWREPGVRGELATLGVERPEQLGALFLADAEQLAETLRGTQPLVDDRPYRVSAALPHELAPEYFALLDTNGSRERFERSRFVARMWPSALRQRTLPCFELQGLLNDYFWSFYGAPLPPSHLRRALANSDLTTLPLLLMGSDPDRQRILAASPEQSPQLALERAAGELAARDYLAAEATLREAQPLAGAPGRLTDYRVLALTLAGELQRARTLAEQARTRSGAELSDARFWALMKESFGLDPKP